MQTAFQNSSHTIFKSDLCCNPISLFIFSYVSVRSNPRGALCINAALRKQGRPRAGNVRGGGGGTWKELMLTPRVHRMDLLAP